jgi:hypothetical protein
MVFVANSLQVISIAHKVFGYEYILQEILLYMTVYFRHKQDKMRHG